MPTLVAMGNDNKCGLCGKPMVAGEQVTVLETGVAEIGEDGDLMIGYSKDTQIEIVHTSCIEKK